MLCTNCFFNLGIGVCYGSWLIVATWSCYVLFPSWEHSVQLFSELGAAEAVEEEIDWAVAYIQKFVQGICYYVFHVTKIKFNRWKAPKLVYDFLLSVFSTGIFRSFLQLHGSEYYPGLTKNANHTVFICRKMRIINSCISPA